MADPDLSDLRTLRAVISAGSFSAAADSLDVKQSTVSYRIDRLRRALGDPLFVREGVGVRPTDRCLDVAARAGRLIDDMADLVAGGGFDPATTTGEAVVACNVYERVRVIPGLARRLRRDAPGLRLRVTPSLDGGAARLREGRCDLLLGPRDPAHDAFDGAHLLSERYVLALDAAHPLARGAATLDDYAAAAHVLVDYGGGWRSPYLDALAALGVSVEPALHLPSIGEIGAVLAATDLIATIPAGFASLLDPAKIAIRPAPFEAGFELWMYWTPRARTSAKGAWLRDAVRDVARGL